MIEGIYKIFGLSQALRGHLAWKKEWMTKEGETLDGSFFYTDSHNDLPLLRAVSNPVAVDPDDVLRAEAEKEKWLIISLKH